ALLQNLGTGRERGLESCARTLFLFRIKPSGPHRPGAAVHQQTPPCFTHERRHSEQVSAAPVDTPRQAYYYDIIFKEAEVAKDKVIALTATSERPASTMSGYAMLVLLLVAIAADVYGIASVNRAPHGLSVAIIIAATIVFILVMPGFY